MAVTGIMSTMPDPDSVAGDKARTRDPGLLRRVAASFAPYRTQVAIVVGLILVTAALGVVNPLLVKVVFDDALFADGGPDLDLLWRLAAIMITLPLLSAGLSIYQTYVTNIVGQRVMAGPSKPPVQPPAGDAVAVLHRHPHG